MDDIWYIGLSNCILREGLYTDFYPGKIVDFALEFYPFNPRDPFRRSLTKTKSVQHIDDINSYSVRAETMLVDENLWVLDFGLYAYRDSYKPEWIVEGEFVEGPILLYVDDLFYDTIKKRIPVIPPLIYTWEISTVFGCSETAGKYTEIDHTDVLRLNISYLLTCKLVDGPKHQRKCDTTL